MRFVFIGGVGRTGTKIITRILSQHPEIGALPFKYRFIIDPDGIIDYIETAVNCWSPFIMDQKLKRLETLFGNLMSQKSKDVYRGWELEKHIPEFGEKWRELILDLISFQYEGIHQGLVEKRQLCFTMYKTRRELNGIFGDFIEDLIGGYLQSVGKSIYADCDTHNILFAKQLFEVLPNSKFIHMKRDPKDTISSLTRQRWSPNSVGAAALWYKGIMERCDSIKKGLPRGAYMEVNLYDLVDDPRRVLNDVCSFIGVDFTDSLMTVQPDKAHRDRWKKDFSPREGAVIDELLGAWEIQ